MKISFCLNSRKWVIGEIPKSCPYLDFQGNKDCVYSGCSYWQDREDNKYIKRKIKLINKIFGE